MRSLTILLAIVLVPFAGTRAANYVEDFNDGAAQGSTVVAGTWAVGSGTVRSSGIGPADIVVYAGATWATDFNYQVRMRNDFANSGNQAGAIYNYRDSNNYYAVQFSPVAPPGDPPGPTAYLIKVISGVTTNILRAPFGGGESTVWFDVDVIRSGAATTVKVNGVVVVDNVTQSELGAGNIGLVTQFTDASFDNVALTETNPSVPFSENFDDDLANGWTIATGKWAIETGAYRSVALGPADISLYTGGSWGTDFTYRARIRNGFGNSGNRAGAVYNYQDSNNYFAVLFSPVAPAGAPPGPTAYLSKVVGGTPTTVATANFSGGESGLWFDVNVIRSGTGSTVRVNDATVFDNVAQPELGAGKVGLMTMFTDARFDNVSLTPPFSCTFETAPTDCGFVEQKRESVQPQPPTVRATITASAARDGPTAVRLHTEPGDDNVHGSGTAERNDLALSQDLTDGYAEREHWWAHSFLLPDDFVAPPNSPPGPWSLYVIADFHDASNGAAQANHHVEVVPNEGMRVRIHGGSRAMDANDALTIVNLGAATKNVWRDLIYHVRWSSGPAGFFDAWLRTGSEAVARKVMEHRGPTLYFGDGIHFKLANYHSPFGQATSVIHDRVIRGVAPGAVTPSGVTLDPGPPAGLPAAVVTAPASGAIVSGTIVTRANASDRGGVGVQFKYFGPDGGGGNIGAEDFSAPYETTWDTTTVPNGTYSLMARVRNTSVNQTTSAPVTVTVAN